MADYKKPRHQQIEKHRRQQSVSNEQVAEKIRREESTVAYDGATPLTDHEAMRGREMHIESIERLLLKMNPNLAFRMSKADPTKKGVYFIDPLNPVVFDPEVPGRFICGMDSGYDEHRRKRPIPEHSMITTKVELIPDPTIKGHTRAVDTFDKEIRRGWLTILARLIHERLIPVEETKRLFEIDGGGERWQATSGGTLV